MTRELDEVPGLGRQYGRATLQALQRVGLPLPWPERGQPTDDLSQTAVSVAGVGLTSGRLAAYRAVCGYAPDDERVPPAYPQVLAFALHLEVITASTFPFRAVGMVHIADSIRQERPLSVAETVDLSVHATDLRPHRRGRQVTLVTEARIGSEQVWREESVYLTKERAAGPSVPDGRTADGAAGDSRAALDRPDGTEGVIAPPPWRLPAELSRRYARASGDRNPIHLYDLTARPFGFRRHIAHGMWTQARALAELGDRLPERFQADVEFRSPLALPATVQFRSADGPAGIDFDVAAAPAGAEMADAPPRTYLVGRVTRL